MRADEETCACRAPDLAHGRCEGCCQQPQGLTADGIHLRASQQPTQGFLPLAPWPGEDTQQVLEEG